MALLLEVAEGWHARFLSSGPAFSSPRPPAELRSPALPLPRRPCLARFQAGRGASATAGCVCVDGVPAA